jgi:hypothetical protein
LLAAVVAVVVATGCEVKETGYSGNPEGPPVLLMGDSIFYGASPALHAALDAEHAVWIHAVAGWDFPLMIQEMQQPVQPAPWATVINLGTNDAIRTDLAQMEAGLEELIALQPADCLVLVTITESRPNEPATNALSAAFNDVLRAEADVVVEWADELAQHPEYAGDDGVHLYDDGNVALAGLVADALDQCAALHPPTPSTTTSSTLPTEDFDGTG